MSDLKLCPFCGEVPFVMSAGMAGQPRWQHPVNDTCPIAGHYLGGWDFPEQWNQRALPAVQPDAAAIREAALREAADVDWASGLEIRDDAPDYLSEWQRGFVSGCTAFRNAILALKGESHE